MNSSTPNRAQPSRRAVLMAQAARWLVILYFCSLAAVMFLETSLVFPGADESRGDWTHAGVPLRDVDFQSSDGTPLHGFIYAPTDSRGSMLFIHGNAENVAMLVPEMKLIGDRCRMTIFFFDYRGFGKSHGAPSEKTVLADTQSAIDWYCDDASIEPHDLYLFGRSLGGGMAVHAAAQNSPRGLILDRTFSSTVDVAASRFWWWPVRMVMRNRFPSHVRLPHYDGPILQMHGDVDEIIPLWSAQRLFETATSNDKEFMLIPGLYHNDPWPTAFVDRVSAFVDRIEGSIVDE